jgi:hypothetical protein
MKANVARSASPTEAAREGLRPRRHLGALVAEPPASVGEARPAARTRRHVQLPVDQRQQLQHHTALQAMMNRSPRAALYARAQALVEQSPRTGSQHRRFRNTFGYGVRRTANFSHSTVQLFDPAEYKIQVAPSERDILLRALDTVMESPLYIGIAEVIRDAGGARVVYDASIDAPAHWNSATRTIALNPRLIEQARMVVAAALAFELGNASQDQQFKVLLQDVESGRVSTAAEYGERAEMIEWESAKLRARAAFQMIPTGEWNQHNDPTLRHFIEKGDSFSTAHGRRIAGDGLWLTFEGFYHMQVSTGHTAGHHERFHELPQRRTYLIEAARERYRQRQQRSSGGSTESKEAMQVDKPKESFGARQQTTDPMSFIDPSQHTRFWETGGSGQDWLGRDGNRWRLVANVEGTYLFKQVL